MPMVTHAAECPIRSSFRVDQVASMFDVPLEEASRLSLDAVRRQVWLLQNEAVQRVVLSAIATAGGDLSTALLTCVHRRIHWTNVVTFFRRCKDDLTGWTFVGTLGRMATQKTHRVKRRKEVRKDQDIRIRVTEEQKQTLTDAATRAGLGVSSWLLMLGLREANENTK